MNSEFIFAVGSKNPVKIKCVAEAIAEFWPESKAIGATTDSGVSNQPKSNNEILAGALNRGQKALKNIPESQFGVGIEGGVIDDGDGMWAYAWVVIVDR